MLIQQLQPEHRYRILPPGVSPLLIEEMLRQTGAEQHTQGESQTETLLRLASPLLEHRASWLELRALQDVCSLWVDGGSIQGLDLYTISAALCLPVFAGKEGLFAGTRGGEFLLEELECERGMVCDLGQTMFKVMWAGRRWAFRRDLEVLPRYGGTGAHTIEEKGEQRRRLRRFVEESLRTAMAEADAGAPEGVVFALPSAMDKWGQPAGSSYIGMSMDTQLVTHALEMAGLPEVLHYVLNDAELAAASAIFDERVIRCGGKALVFTLGTAVGCAIADPLAAALHFAGVSREVPG